jgi:branched-chain amino acid transport system substrate-binding protein
MKSRIGVITILAAASIAQQPSARANEIKIGLIHPFSGPLATPGREATNGFVLYFEQQKNTVAGRPIKIIQEDTAAMPARGIERSRRLVEREQVHLLTGVTSSAVGYAIRDYVHEKKIPLVIMGAAGANGLTAERASPYIFRTSFSNRQFNAPFGKYACEKLGYKRVAVMSSDFITGHEQSAAFEDGMKSAGCAVSVKILAPLGTVDFTPFLSRIPGDVQAVWAMFFGADAIAFVKQYDQLGLKARLPLIGSAGLIDERILASMGKSAFGIVAPVYYFADLENEANGPFVEAYKAKYGILPGSTSSGGYVAAMAIATALETVGGKIEDTEAFLSALRKVNLPVTPQGLIHFDQKQNVVFDLWAVKIAEKSSSPTLQLIEGIAKRVTQDWPK